MHNFFTDELIPCFEKTLLENSIIQEGIKTKNKNQLSK